MNRMSFESFRSICSYYAMVSDGNISEYAPGITVCQSDGDFYSRIFIDDNADEDSVKCIFECINSDKSNGFPSNITIRGSDDYTDFRKLTDSLTGVGISQLTDSLTGVCLSQLTGMVKYITDNDKSCDCIEEGYAIIINRDMLKSWVDSLEIGFDEENADDMEIYGNFLKNQIRNILPAGWPREDRIKIQKLPAVRLYAYILDGKIISTALIYIHPQLSGIYEISTVPEYRKRGAAGRLIKSICRDIRDMGINAVSLQAVEGTENFYSELGFLKTENIINIKIC